MCRHFFCLYRAKQCGQKTNVLVSEWTAQVFIVALIFSDVLKEQMKIAEMKSVIKGLSSHEDEKVKSQIKEMKGIFDKG